MAELGSNMSATRCPSASIVESTLGHKSVPVLVAQLLSYSTPNKTFSGWPQNELYSSLMNFLWYSMNFWMHRANCWIFQCCSHSLSLSKMDLKKGKIHNRFWAIKPDQGWQHWRNNDGSKQCSVWWQALKWGNEAFNAAKNVLPFHIFNKQVSRSSITTPRCDRLIEEKHFFFLSFSFGAHQ